MLVVVTLVFIVLAALVVGRGIRLAEVSAGEEGPLSVAELPETFRPAAQT